MRWWSLGRKGLPVRVVASKVDRACSPIPTSVNVGDVLPATTCSHHPFLHPSTSVQFHLPTRPSRPSFLIGFQGSKWGWSPRLLAALQLPPAGATIEPTPVFRVACSRVPGLCGLPREKGMVGGRERSKEGGGDCLVLAGYCEQPPSSHESRGLAPPTGRFAAEGCCSFPGPGTQSIHGARRRSRRDGRGKTWHRFGGSLYGMCHRHRHSRCGGPGHRKCHGMYLY